ncbi:MAG: lytic transglycosylase domain-containing protein [Pseudomonadota bacterium]
MTARHSFIAALLGLIALVGPALAEGDAALCANAARTAEKTHQIPEGYLRAISLVETNRGVAGEDSPWPWTVNVDGKGHWFDTRAAAENFVSAKEQAGVSSMDIGCFQINTRWHKAHFDDTATMFDPATSAAYAADFLRSLKDQTGNWRGAVGRYHSRTPAFAERYGDKVMSALEVISAPSVERPVVKSVTLSRPTALRGGVALTMFESRAPLLDRSARRNILIDP